MLFVLVVVIVVFGELWMLECFVEVSCMLCVSFVWYFVELLLMMLMDVVIVLCMDLVVWFLCEMLCLFEWIGEVCGYVLCVVFGKIFKCVYGISFVVFCCCSGELVFVIKV